MDHIKKVLKNHSIQHNPVSLDRLSNMSGMMSLSRLLRELPSSSISHVNKKRRANNLSISSKKSDLKSDLFSKKKSVSIAKLPNIMHASISKSILLSENASNLMRILNERKFIPTDFPILKQFILDLRSDEKDQIYSLMTKLASTIERLVIFKPNSFRINKEALDSMRNSSLKESLKKNKLGIPILNAQLTQLLYEEYELLWEDFKKLNDHKEGPSRLDISSHNPSPKPDPHLSKRLSILKFNFSSPIASSPKASSPLPPSPPPSPPYLCSTPLYPAPSQNQDRALGDFSLQGRGPSYSSLLSSNTELKAALLSSQHLASEFDGLSNALSLERARSSALEQEKHLVEERIKTLLTQAKQTKTHLKALRSEVEAFKAQARRVIAKAERRERRLAKGAARGAVCWLEERQHLEHELGICFQDFGVPKELAPWEAIKIVVSKMAQEKKAKGYGKEQSNKKNKRLKSFAVGMTSSNNLSPPNIGSSRVVVLDKPSYAMENLLVPVESPPLMAMPRDRGNSLNPLETSLAIYTSSSVEKVNC